MGYPHRPGLALGSGNAEPRAFPAPWPPGPAGDWTGIPEWFWPAVHSAAKSRLRGVAHGIRAELVPCPEFDLRWHLGDSCLGWRGVLSVCRSARWEDAMTDRVDRLRALGNGVVPPQAELALRALYARVSR